MAALSFNVQQTAPDDTKQLLLALERFRAMPTVRDDSGRRGCSSCASSTQKVLLYKARDETCDWDGWFLSVFSRRGRSCLHTIPPLLLVMIVAVVRTFALQTGWLGGEIWGGGPAIEKIYPTLMVPVSFLLTYRMNRTAVRFYDSRQKFGLLIEKCRIVVAQAVTYFAHDIKTRNDICRWSVAYPVASRNYLRKLRTEEVLILPDPCEELQGILSPSDAAALLAAPMQPLLCLDRMRMGVLKASRSNKVDSQQIVAAVLQSIDEEINLQTGTMGAMERINNTPLPFAYVAHLRTFLVMYLLGLPFAFGNDWGWATPVVIGCIAFSLLGIEAAGVACERPFGLGSNHLPMDLFCETVMKNVSQILKQADAYASEDGAFQVSLPAAQNIELEARA